MGISSYCFCKFMTQFIVLLLLSSFSQIQILFVFFPQYLTKKLCNEKSEPKSVTKPETQATLLQETFIVSNQATSDLKATHEFLCSFLADLFTIPKNNNLLFCTSQVVFHLLTLHRKPCLLTLWRMSRSSYINSFSFSFYIITSQLPSLYLSPFANMNTRLVPLLLFLQPSHALLPFLSFSNAYKITYILPVIKYFIF